MVTMPAIKRKAGFFMFSLTRALIRHHRQLAVVGSLLFATAVCVTLFFLRAARTSGFTHSGLMWNLFLAWVPMVCALAAYNLAQRASLWRWLALGGCVPMWLVFFPNAPYMVTDITHLRPLDNVPLWYDLIFIIACAWTSFFLGLISLYLMQGLVRRAWGTLAGWLFTLGVVALCGVGVYLGRFLRWNSWDIFFNPVQVLADVVEPLFHPLAHFSALAFSGVFSVFFISVYLMLFALTHFQKESYGPIRD